MKKIWLAGGCFWGVEAYFRQLKGVLATKVGYGQGTVPDPGYRQVCSGSTGHAEICEITYDAAILSTEKLLEHFFRIIDPTSLNRQGPDCGTQYRTGIYYADEADKSGIIAIMQQMQERYQAPIVVEVEALRNFYPAEEYHQDYLTKTPGGYCHINLGLAKPGERR